MEVSKHFTFLFIVLIIFLISPSISYAQTTQYESLDIGKNENYTIDSLEVRDFSQVTLLDNSSVLTINGTLIVHGDLKMDGNKSQFIMGPNARVIIFGDFIASNKVTVDVKSYLIIHGDFIKTSSDNQGELNVSNGNIYIFGNQSGWGEDFETCDEYLGDTDAIVDENCDYGTGDDYTDNQDDFPPDLIDLLDCFNLSKLKDRKTCENEAVIFSVNLIPDVIYDWQVKKEGGEWTSINGNEPAAENNSLAISSSDSIFVNGNKFRVVVKATGEQTCKIVVSNVATLTILTNDFTVEDIKGLTATCAGTSGISYSIPAIDNAISYTWIVPADWTIENGQNTSQVFVTAGKISGEVKVSITNFCGTTKESDLSVKVEEKGKWTGNTSTDWNTPENWGCNMIPTATTNVLIPAGLTNYPLLNSGAIGTAKNISIENGASLEIINNTLKISGEISSADTFIASEGTVILNGTVTQTIPQNTFANNRIRNLTIENPANVTLAENLEITGILKAATGNLKVQDTLTLISDENQTALIDGSGNGEIIGTVKMQRYLDNSFGYKYFSSPFQSSIVGDFSAYVDLNAAFPNFYRYNENRQDSTGNDATGWEVYTTATSTLNPIEGYALNFGSTTKPVTVELSGTLNNEIFSRKLYNHNGTYTEGFNLVGNPYPSPIDWDAATGWTKTNIDDAIYFFTAGNTDQYTGTYTSYVNGIASKDGKSSHIIPSMQGFFVHVSDATIDTSQTVGILSMTNEVRINDFSQKFLKKPEKEKYPLLRISAGFENEHQNDPLVIYFDPYSSPQFEKDLDAHKLMNTAVNVPNFYSITPKNEKLAINAIPNPVFNATERIPLGLKTEKGGTIFIKLEDLQNLSSGAYIYLIDQEKRMAQNLNQYPVYRFQVKKGKQDSRFYLLFSENRLTDPAIAFDEPFSVTTGNRQISVHINLDQGVKGALRVSTVSGKILEILKVEGKETVEIKGIRSAGIYFINLLSEGETFSKKVLVKE